MKSKLELTVEQLRPGLMLCTCDEDIKEFLVREGRIQDAAKNPKYGNQVAFHGETEAYCWTCTYCYDTPGDEGYILCLGDKTQISREQFVSLMYEVFSITAIPGAPMYFLPGQTPIVN